MQVFEFPSSSDPGKVYQTTVLDDGSIVCDTRKGNFCRGFMFSRTRPASCTHTKKVAALLAKQQSSLGLEVDHALSGRAEGEASASPERPTSMSDRSGWVRPMLASPLEGRSLDEFANGEWWLEEKFDGHRVIVAVRPDGSVAAWSRPRAGKNDGLPRTLPAHVHDVMRQMPPGTYDGELIVPGGNSWDVVNLELQHKVCLVLFDVLVLESLDDAVSSMAWEERRPYLAALGDTLTALHVEAVYVAEAFEVSRENVQAIWDRGGEGAILKRKAAQYRPGARSADWIKVKKLFTDVIAVTGFRAGSFGPHSVVEGTLPNGVATSVKTKDGDWIREFDQNGASYVGRKLQIEHQGLFKGAPRHPMFDHFVD